MINIKTIYRQALTESKASRLKHLFDDGTMRFDDFRNIFKNVFSGKIGVTSKVKKIPLYITCKDGQYALADGKNSIKDPFTVDKVCQRCKCSEAMSSAVSETIGSLVRALEKLDIKDRNSIFANGQNFYAIDIILPPESCIKDYGNRCFLQKNKVNSFDSTFSKVVEDEETTTKLSEKIKLDKALKECCCEISPECVSRLKSSMSPDAALKELMSDLDAMVDGIGYKATVNDYVREHFAKYIINAALKRGIDLYSNSDFVQELIARLSHVSDHRPSKGDLITYAKRGGVDFKAPEYTELMNDLEQNADSINDKIMQPVEMLVLKAGMFAVKCFLGLVAVDPRGAAKKLLPVLDQLLTAFEGCDSLDPEKVHSFRKSISKLKAYQQSIPEEGLPMLYNGKVCRICGKFGNLEDLGKLMQI